MNNIVEFNVNNLGNMDAIIYYRAASALQEARDALADQTGFAQTEAIKTTALTLRDLLESWLARNMVSIDQVRFAASDAGNGGSVHQNQVKDILDTYDLLSSIIDVKDDTLIGLVD